MGYAVTSTAESCEEDQGIGQRKAKPVIGFDMGGTSTDVSRFDGSFEHIFESTTAGVSIRAPQVRRRRGEGMSLLSSKPASMCDGDAYVYVCVFAAGYQHGRSWWRLSFVLSFRHVCSWSGIGRS